MIDLRSTGGGWIGGRVPILITPPVALRILPNGYYIMTVQHFSVISRADFPKLLSPGTVVWRPVYEGRAQPVKVYSPTLSKRDYASNVFVLPYSLPNLIHEPSVSWYSGEQTPRGVVCFLKTKAGVPLHGLPDNWYGIQIIKAGVTSFVGTPVICPDIAEYERFRLELAEVFAEPTKASQIRFSIAPELPRLYVRPVVVDVGTSDLEVLRF